MDGRLTTVETNLTQAQDGIVALQGDIVRLDEEDDTLHGLIDTANTNITTADNAISMLKSRLDASDAIISALTARLQVLEAGRQFVFVTSKTYSGGEIGGITGAHSKCQALADAAELSGTFKAWLSDSTGYSPDQDFVKSDVPYVTTTGIQVANDWQDLTTNLDIDNPISVTENGNSTSTRQVWTGTDVNGTPKTYGGGFCNDWRSSDTSLFAVVGNSGNSEQFWTSGGSISCRASLRLYCFEQ